MLHELIELRTVERFGTNHCGLFVKGPIPAGTVVWWHDKERDAEALTLTRHQILNHVNSNILARYSYLVGPDTYCTTEDPSSDISFFFNHSCDGSTWYDGDDKVIAKRDLVEGDEIAYDYALTETEASFHAGIHCKCGSAKCVGVLKFDRYRDPHWVAEHSGHMSSYIAHKARELGWHHPAVIPFRHPAGGSSMGLKAIAPIQQGETLLYFGGKVVGRDAFLATQKVAPTQHFLQVADQLWMVPGAGGSDTADLINHGCEPNCGMRDSVTVVSLRGLSPEEELLLDYATVMDDTLEETGLETFECRCGAAGCRGTITPSDYKRTELQQRYAGFFTPFLAAKLQQLPAP